MAAVLADGTSTIENAAKEPEVQDLANLLNCMGAKVSGAGGPVITVEGVERLHGCSAYPVIPDRIEAGTFLMAAAITRSTLRVEPVVPEHLNSVLQKLRDCGCQLDIDGVGITIRPGEIKAVDVITQPFPGFPTDLQAPFMALMATAQGTSVISEKIYENRMQHVAELQRMGASIRIEGSTGIVEGVPRLSGAPVTGSDLRASAAMVLAAGLLPTGQRRSPVLNISIEAMQISRPSSIRLVQASVDSKAEPLTLGFLQSRLRERAGIGRRTRLKIERLRACGFKSHRSHCSHEHLQPFSAHIGARKRLLGLGAIGKAILTQSPASPPAPLATATQRCDAR